MNAVVHLLAASDWSSLEVVKLLVAIATPIVVALVGFRLASIARTVEQHQWTDRKVIERRIDVFDKMAEPLNDLYVFFLRVGHCQELTPPDAIARKRQLDRVFFVNHAVLSPAFATAYNTFMAACFVPYAGGVGRSALLRTSAGFQRAERGDRWQEEWEPLFVAPSDSSDDGDIASAYRELTACFGEDLGVPQAN